MDGWMDGWINGWDAMKAHVKELLTLTALDPEECRAWTEELNTEN